MQILPGIRIVKYWALLLLCVGVVPFSWAQSTGELWQKGIEAYGKGQADSCVYFLTEAAGLYEVNEQWDSVAWCYRYALAMLNYRGEFKEVIQRGEECLARLPKEDYGVVRILMMVGYAYEENWKILEAYNAYERAYLISIRQGYYDPGLGSYLYRPLANLATRLGEYERAKGLLSRWLIELQKNPDSQILRQEASSDLSVVWLSLKQPDSALVVLKKALLVGEGSFHSRGHLLIRMAEANLAKGDIDAGLQAVEAGIALLQKRSSEEADWERKDRIGYLSAAWEEKGKLLQAGGSYAAAMVAYKEALALRDLLPPVTPNRPRAKLLARMGKLAQEQDLNAKSYFLLALGELVGNQMVGLDSAIVYAENAFVSVLPGLAKVYEAEGQLDSARWALRWGLVAGQALWQSLSQESAKLELSQVMHQMYGESVRLAMQSEAHQAEALQWHEGHRAAYLQESVLRNQVERQVLPDSLLRLSRRLQASLQLPGVSAEQRFVWSQANDTLQAYLQTHYPISQSGIAPPTVRQIQSRLTERGYPSVVLSYAWYPPYLYAWGITADDIVTAKWEVPDLPAQVARLTDLLTNLQAATERPTAVRSAFMEQGFSFYQQYVSPLIMQVGEDLPLIILPDGPLQDLPLELLPLDPVDVPWKEAPYLLRSRSVGYLPALQWLFSPPTSLANTELVALAAKYPEEKEQVLEEYLALRDGEVPLPFARDEVEGVTNYWRSKAMFSATEEDFRTLAPQAGVLHLAMHAYTNLYQPQKSGLQFSPPVGGAEGAGFLFQAELLATPLQAQLVTLSACNTGVGQRQPGEGPLSLARSFLQAGAGGVTMSLWKVPDRETSQLMQLYYAELAEGMVPTQALRQAKLRYLEETTEAMRAHPFFWAGFVHTGQDEVLQIRRSHPFRRLLWPVLMLAGFSLVLVFRRYMRNI